MTFIDTETRAIQYQFSVEIERPRAAVWHALTESTDAWWLPDFRCVGPGSEVTLEPRAGGRLIEHQAGGGSLLWYTVQMCSPEASLDLVGHLAPGWGGPATSMLRLELEDAPNGTLLRVRDALVGAVTEASASSAESGWRTLFGDGLKAWAERAGGR